MVVVQDEFWAIIWPAAHVPEYTVPERRPASSILNHLSVAEFTPVQVVPGHCAR